MEKNVLFDYSQLLSQVKRRVALAQQRAIYAANEEMLHMYWDIGELLKKSQIADGWGKKTLERLSIDLKNEYPKVKGFSVRNLQCMIQFYEEYKKMTQGQVHRHLHQERLTKGDNEPLPVSHRICLRKTSIFSVLRYSK